MTPARDPKQVSVESRRAELGAVAVVVAVVVVVLVVLAVAVACSCGCCG